MFCVGELADRVGGHVVGDASAEITGLATIVDAGPGDLTHLSSRAYRRHLAGTGATAVLIRAADVETCPTNAIVCDNPYLAFARLSQLFDDAPVPAPGRHPSAVVAADARVADDAAIGPGAVIGARAVVAAGVVIGANTVVGEDCVVGDASRLNANVTLYHRVRIGARCVVHAGAVLGADGFGFTPDADGRLTDIAQIGGVVLGDDVSIGAATTIDRGAIEDTRIGNGVKIDNQVQIGHNCVIGDHTVICGCAGIVGSTRIGRHVVLAGGVGVGGDGPIEIVDRVVVSGMTHVSRSIVEPGVYSGGVLHARSSRWKRNALRFDALDELARRVARLERGAAGDADDNDGEHRE